MTLFNNLQKAASSQQSLFKWFKDGVSGIVKCVTNNVSYSDEQIKSNRDVCRQCKDSTKDQNGQLTLKSQCMAVNPADGQVCGCFIVCKTQTDKCPLGKWTDITISKS